MEIQTINFEENQTTYGYGDRYGDGDGYGDGYGYGDGDGYGSGSGDGYGYGELDYRPTRRGLGRYGF